MKPLLAVKNISYSVWENSLIGKRNEKKILENISFEVASGEILGIAGPSGGGKTTLAKLMIGIFEPTNGEIIKNFLKSENRAANRIQLLFQNSEEIANPFRKVKDILIEVLQLKNGKSLPTKERLSGLLSDVNIHENLLEKYCMQLSGGQRQRVALARLLAVEPEILILDEPFSAQDVESQLNLLLLLKKINAKKRITLICISHQENVLNKLTPRIIRIKEGKLVSE
ncbi:MAG: ATP-binding cassette domain-containing protein [Ignavibacteriaceae bacterium]|jgi:peptide/nickel transport system ATP-binding protein|nr:ATP-binding cassette domain-containing protein [Ignavibacteriaceae bacterium]